MKNEKKFKEKIENLAFIIAEEDSFDIGKSRKRPEPAPFKGISYVGMKLSPGMEKQAMDVVSKIAADSTDEVKKVTLTKKRIGGSQGRGVSIIFKVDFKNVESFVGLIELPDSDLYKQPIDPDEPGSISLNPGVPTDDSGRIARDSSGNIYKSRTGKSTGFSPVSPGSKSSDPRKMFAYLKEMVRDNPKITAMFVNASGKNRNLKDANFVQPQTKDAIMKFLNDLSKEELMEDNDNKNKNMKKDFKEKISEIAARIAEGNYEKDDVTEAEAEIPAGVLTQYNSEVQDGATLAKVLIRIINQIIEKEPSLQDLDKRSGWAIIMPKLKVLADPKQKNPGAEKSSASDNSDLPALQEAFNRINRK